MLSKKRSEKLANLSKRDIPTELRFVRRTPGARGNQRLMTSPKITKWSIAKARFM